MTIPITLKKTVDESYNITVDGLPTLEFKTNVAIVTNPTVASFHLERVLEKIVAPRVTIVTIPDGEEYKTLETLMGITDELFENRFDRKSLLIALGGGVVGDMTGFAAAIFQRGIDFVQIPTTLLSMVDASVGGKTGINTRYGKNLLGSFNQPKGVYIDPTFLQTLPPREFAAGMAEVIKMAVTFDKGFFEWLEEGDLSSVEAQKEMICRCATLKAHVVAMDEKEQGIRAVLNYGHTFGHVIENLEGYGTYLHGEAVALGMVMANKVAVSLGLLSCEEEERIENLLKKMGLPTAYRICDVEKFYDLFFLDKKSSQGKLAFIFPVGIGGNVIRDDLSKESIMEVLRGFCG